jgi:hypothetical protein
MDGKRRDALQHSTVKKGERNKSTWKVGNIEGLGYVV